VSINYSQFEYNLKLNIDLIKFLNRALVGDAASPNFKECQKLIMQSAPDSGLLTLLAQKF
jgi:hypothetical protein